MVEIVKKITARDVACEGKIGDSFIIFGRLMRATPAASQYGEYVKFGGQFGAVNEQTKKEYRSAVFLAPGIAEDQLYSALQSVQETDKSATCEFAFRFKTKADKTAARGYVWTAEPLVKPSGDDPLIRLRGQIEGLPEIEAPKEQEKK